MAAGAARLSMPAVPEQQFVQAVADTVRANAGEPLASAAVLIVSVTAVFYRGGTDRLLKQQQ